MDDTKIRLARCIQLIYVVTFPVQPEDEEQFQVTECTLPGNNIPTTGDSDIKYGTSQPVKLVPSDKNDPSFSLSYDRGSKNSECFVSNKSTINGKSAECSDNRLHGSQWSLANEVSGPKPRWQHIVSESSQHIIQEGQKYDQRVPSDSRTSNQPIGNYPGNYMQGFSISSDKEPFYDAVIVYDQNDFTEVQLFKEELTYMMTTEGFPGLRLVLFDSTVFPASHIMSIEDIVRRSILVLVYLTPQFNPKRLELFCNEILGLTRLGYNEPDVLAGRMENTQKWAFRPVHTQHEKARYYKTPIGLTTVIGMNWYDRYSPNTRQKIISLMAQALHDRTQRENNAHLTGRYRELYMQHRKSDQRQAYANESIISSFNSGSPSQVIRPHYENLCNARSETWTNYSHGLRIPVNPGFHQFPHIVRQSVPQTQIPYQSNGSGAQIMNMTQCQRPQLSMIPEQTLEQSGSFKSGQELHPHVGTVPNYGMQHQNTGQHSLSQASVDAFSIRSQDAYSDPFQHKLSTARPQSAMSFVQSASLYAGQLNKTGYNGHYCGRDQVSDRNISYQQAPKNAGSNMMFHKNLTGFTGQERPQIGRYIPDFTTSNQSVGQPDSEAFFKDMKAYQSTGSEYNRMGVDVANVGPFQTARIDSSIGNRPSHTGRNIIVQSSSVSSQAIPVDSHPQFIPQGMQRNAQTALSPGNPQLSYQNMTSVVYPPIQGSQRSSFMIDSNSQAQIQDNFSRQPVFHPPSEYQQRRPLQLHAYQQQTSHSGLPLMQKNMHQMSSVSIPSSHLPIQEPFCEYPLTTHTTGHQSEHIENIKQGNIQRQDHSLVNVQPNQKQFDMSSSPSMQIPSQMLYTCLTSVRPDQPQSSLGNVQSNHMIGRQTANNANNIPCESDRRYTSLLNSGPSVNKQSTQINCLGPASLYGYKSDDKVQSSDLSTGLEQSVHNFKPFNNKKNEEIDINTNLSNDDLEIDKIPSDSGLFHQTSMKKQMNMNTSKEHNVANTSGKMDRGVV
ncbi:hypothetical protein CHS0354_005393 [Potamilus streckersoni]|uniref:Uncharacterized protein n=1 Tax=Potamilus streckersoni TaxID=2493646 RepID=A0AAE0SJT2_9BIVA|nr:hypothetical protein CHS0354_005393 [Potamilus streckersoni]